MGVALVDRAGHGRDKPGDCDSLDSLAQEAPATTGASSLRLAPHVEASFLPIVIESGR